MSNGTEVKAPYWQNRQNMLMTVLVTGCFLLCGWALDTSMEALSAAKSARPHPFTSIDHKKYDQHHNKYINERFAGLEEIISGRFELMEARLTHRIETLPRPPEKVRLEMRSLGERIRGLEAVFNQALQHSAGRFPLPEEHTHFDIPAVYGVIPGMNGANATKK